MQENDFTRQHSGQGIEANPRRELIDCRVLESLTMFTIKGKTAAGFSVTVDDGNGVHKQRVILLHRDLIDHSRGHIRVGEEITIDGEFYIWKKTTRRGKRKIEKRIRAFGIKAK